MTGAWHIHEDPLALGLELEGLGVRVQLHICDLLAGLRVDRGQSTVAIADPEAAGDLSYRTLSASSFSSMVAVCCSDVPSYNRYEPSWSLATASRLDSGTKPIPCSVLRFLMCCVTLPAVKIDHLDTVVSECGDEEPFTLSVQAEVIEAALDAVQRNRPDLSQQVGALARSLRGGVHPMRASWRRRSETTVG
jgi:hypothetical protein